MEDEVPSVTVVIAARPEQAEVTAVTNARKLEYPAEKIEIIVARGKQPSVQRNAAIRSATGAIIYFLDDDSLAEPGNLSLAIAHFSNQNVKMVGGPNVCPEDAPALQQVFALVLSSWLAFGPSRARYTPVGQVRAATEKELILCNLAARRDVLLELGGFNEALYPNEENALMDELHKRGGKLIYDPQFLVYRHPRRTLAAFARMIVTYGRGRTEQFRVNPTAGSVLNFVPPLFLLYVLSLVGVLWIGPIWWVPLGLYFLAVLAQSVLLAFRGGPLRALGAMPLIILTHILYGVGFWRGLFTPLKPAPACVSAEVVLQKV